MACTVEPVFGPDTPSGVTRQPFVHPAPAKSLDEAQEFLIQEGIITRTALDTIIRLTKERNEFAGTQQDTITSFVKTSGELVKVKRERDAARHAWHEASITIMRRTNVAVRLEQIVAEQEATIGLLDEDVAGWISRAVGAEDTVERIKAIVADPQATLVVDRIRAALEEVPS